MNLNPLEPPLRGVVEQPLVPPGGRSPLLQVLMGPDGLRAGWSLLLFLVLLVGIGFGVRFAVLRMRPPHPASTTQASSAARPDAHKAATPKMMITAEGSTFLVVLLTTFILGRVERRPLGTYGFGGVHRGSQFFQGLAWGVLFLSLLVGLLDVLGYLRFDGRLLGASDAVRYGSIWGAGFLLVACLEESLTRGFLQYTLARGLAAIYGNVLDTAHRHALGFWTAALLFSFLFGLGHSSNPGESPIGLLSAGLAGLLFCFALYRAGSLWWALGFHASWDWAQSFLYGVPDSGTMVEGHLFATHPIGKPILSGGLTGPEGSIFIIPILGLAAAIVYFTVPQTHRPGAGLSHPDCSPNEGSTFEEERLNP